MSELLPIMSGILAGVLLGSLRPSFRLPVGLLLAVILGVAATVVSGEFKASWGYLMIDIPLVAVSAAVGMVVARRLRPAGRHVNP